MSSSASRSATAAGLGAVVIWSSWLGLSRVVFEAIGPMTAGAIVHLLAGGVGLAWALRSRRARRELSSLSWRYIVGCGVLFVGYTLCLLNAVARASGHQEVLVVGLINYLWPAATLVLSIPLLAARPRPFFPLGILLAVIGLVLMTGGGQLRWSAFAASLGANMGPYALALVAALGWALYSNLARRWGGRTGEGAVPVFILATGVAMAFLALHEHHAFRLTFKIALAMLYWALVVNLVGYVLWEIAVRRGNLTLVASAAYLIPLFSTLISCQVLGIWPPPAVWVACGLVIAGAFICQRSLRESGVG